MENKLPVILREENIPAPEPLTYQELQVAAVLSGRLLQRYDINTRVLSRYYNSEFLFGIPKTTADYPSNMLVHDIIAPESKLAFTAFYDSLQRGVSTGSCEVRIRLPINGEYRWYHLEYSTIYDTKGLPSHAIISLYDSTMSREKDIAFEKWQMNLAALLEKSKIYAEFNLSRNVLERQTGMESASPNSPGNRIGCSLDEFVDYGAKHLIVEEDAQSYRDFFDRGRLKQIFESGIYEDNLEYRDCANGVRWFRVNVQMVQYPHSEDIKAFLVFTDINDSREELERLNQQVCCDPLTGLLNRTATEERIQKYLDRSDGTAGMALYMIDLDNFKHINDKLGHQHGDTILMQAAAAIRDVFRAGDVIGRMGGDEFMVFLPGPLSEKVALDKAEALVQALKIYADDKGKTGLSASVGVVAFSGMNKTFDELYRLVDKALYSAKEDGKDRYTLVRVKE